MKKTRKLAALALALMMLLSATAAFASTYVSDPVSPAIAGPSASEPTAAADQTVEPEQTAEPADGEQAGDAVETEAVVKTETENGSVNIRAAASTDAEIIGQLTGDARVTVLGTEGDWTKVRADGVVGYVFSKYLQVSEPAATPAPVETKREVRIGTTLGDVINLGDSVTMSAELIGFDGTTVTLQWQQNTGGGWHDVSGANGLSFSYTATEETVNSQWRIAVKIVG